MTLDSTPDSTPDSNLRGLMTEAANTASGAIDRMSPLEVVRLMNAEDATVADAVARELPVIARAVAATRATSLRPASLLSSQSSAAPSSAKEPPATQATMRSGAMPNVGGHSMASSAPNRPDVPAPA